MTRRTRIITFSILGVLLVGCSGILTFCVGGPSYYNDKYSPSATRQQPTHFPSEFVPQSQTEPHTCGFHSLGSAYTAYGINAETARLRFRLGTDVPANLLAPDTTGTIHPDILRVLEQDGFNAEVLYSKDTFAPSLREHLAKGHPAMLLITVNSWHWVLACGVRDDSIVICDSLKPELYEEPLDEYLASRVHNVILIQPKH